jgi:hypothetical protein
MALGLTDDVWSFGEPIDAALGAAPPKPTPSAPDRCKQFRYWKAGNQPRLERDFEYNHSIRGDSMQKRYTPILKWKQGERIALHHLSPTARIDVTPNIVITQAQFDPSSKKKASSKPSKKSPPPPSEYLAKQIADAWGKTTFFLDVSDLPGTATKHVLDDIASKANAAGLSMAPSTKLNAPPEYIAAVSRVAKHDGRGAVLRISLNQISSAAIWMGSWPLSFADTDLVIDLANSVATVLALGPPIFVPFQSLYQATAWRSVTLAGGSIPATLSGYRVGCTMLPRAELQLWIALKKANLDYELQPRQLGELQRQPAYRTHTNSIALAFLSP